MQVLFLTCWAVTPCDGKQVLCVNSHPGPQIVLFQWKAQGDRLKPEAEEQGSYIFCGNSLWETGHLCPTPAQPHDSVILWEERVFEGGVFPCVMVWGWIISVATEIGGRSPSKGISFIYYEIKAFSSPSVLYIAWTASRVHGKGYFSFFTLFTLFHHTNYIS